MKNLLKKCYRLLNNEKLVFAIFILYYIGRTGGNTSFVTQWPATDKGFQVLRMLGFFFFGIETVKLAIGYLKEKHTAMQMLLMLGFVLLLGALGMNFIIQGAYTFLTDIMMAFVMSVSMVLVSFRNFDRMEQNGKIGTEDKQIQGE